MEDVIYTCRLLLIITSLWGFLLAGLRQTQKPIISSAIEHYVFWSVSWVCILSTDLCNLQLLAYFCLEHMLYICSEFYDGYKPVMELLSKSVFMISDLTHTRYIKVATLL